MHQPVPLIVLALSASPASIPEELGWLFIGAGILGSALIVSAFALTSWRKMKAGRPPALIMNAAGAALVLVSLVKDFNLGAAILETVWLLVSVTALILFYIRGERTEPSNDDANPNDPPACAPNSTGTTPES